MKKATGFLLALLLGFVSAAGPAVVRAEAETAAETTAAAPSEAADPAPEESFTEEALANLNAQDNDAAPEAVMKTEMNILLIGQDARQGEGRQRSDSMVLCHVDTVTGKITMVSFMRDLYVAIPGHGSSRLNHAYPWGGMELLDQAIEQNFGVHVDYNIEADFESFPEIIDSLGGVDIELSSGEAGVLGVSAGMNHLTGAQALSFARIRKIDSDFERTNRQRKVLAAVYGKFRNLEFAEQMKLIQSFLGMLKMDIPLMDALNLVSSILKNGVSLNEESYRIPADGAYSNQNISGMAVLVPDLEANKALLRQWLGMEESAAGTGEAGAGGHTDAATIQKVQQALNAAGFNCGTADGISGPKTREALHQYQQANGLTVSDQITDELLAAMGIS